jgi:hypothetical protein
MSEREEYEKSYGEFNANTPAAEPRPVEGTNAIYGPASEVIEPFDVGPIGKLTLTEWVEERLKNCLRIAAQKNGAVKAGWLEDAHYFKQILAVLASSPSPSEAERIAERMGKRLLRDLELSFNIKIDELCLRAIIREELERKLP